LVRVRTLFNWGGGAGAAHPPRGKRRLWQTGLGGPEAGFARNKSQVPRPWDHCWLKNPQQNPEIAEGDGRVRGTKGLRAGAREGEGAGGPGALGGILKKPRHRQARGGSRFFGGRLRPGNRTKQHQGGTGPRRATDSSHHPDPYLSFAKRKRGGRNRASPLNQGPKKTPGEFFFSPAGFWDGGGGTRAGGRAIGDFRGGGESTSKS